MNTFQQIVLVFFLSTPLSQIITCRLLTVKKIVQVAVDSLAVEEAVAVYRQLDLQKVMGPLQALSLMRKAVSL